MAPTNVRALHYVLKVADRTATVHFLHDALGMRALRHEEFETGCKAACNGPFDGRWSKTMMGYASEDTSFTLELTYNYGVSHYRLGNDFGYLKIRNRVAFKSLEEQGLGQEIAFNVREARSPDGHTFRVLNEEPTDAGTLASLCLNVASLERAAAFYQDVLGFLEIDKGGGDGGNEFVVLSCGAGQATLRLTQLPPGVALDRGTGYGHLAFSCPAADLAPLQEEVQQSSGRVLTPLVSLATPGKATVRVVIIADPDSHEICFVGDEAFRELSREDDEAPTLLQRAMSKDMSKEWREAAAQAGKAPASPTAALKAPAAAAVPAAAAAVAAPTVPAPGAGSPKAAAAAVAGGK